MRWGNALNILMTSSPAQGCIQNKMLICSDTSVFTNANNA